MVSGPLFSPNNHVISWKDQNFPPYLLTLMSCLLKNKFLYQVIFLNPQKELNQEDKLMITFV